MDIRRLTPRDLAFAHDLTCRENWGQEQEEIEQLYDLAQSGAMVAIDGDSMHGMVFASNYGPFGVIANLIVAQKHRGKGCGRALLDHALAYFDELGTPTVLLDGVPSVVPLYEHVGFQRLCKSYRFRGPIPKRRSAEVVAITAEIFPQICQLDRKIFGADRTVQLARLWRTYPEYALCLLKDGEVGGFLFGFPRPSCLKVGPWVVSAGEPRAAALLQHAMAVSPHNEAYLGVLETSVEAVDILTEFGLEPYSYSIRMARGPPAAMSPQIFAIGGPDRG